MDLPGSAAAGGHAAGDLPQADRLPFTRPVADGQRDGGVGQVVLMLPAPVISAGDGGELAGGQVGGGALAPGQQVEPGFGDVGEQGRGPAAPVEAHRHAPPVAYDLPQLREQPAQLAGQRVRRLGGHHEHGLPVLAGDPGLPGGRGGELQPRDVHLLHVPGAVVGARVPVHVEEPQRLGPGGGVPAGQRHDQVAGLAGGGELAELAADRLDFRGPVQAEHPAQRRGRDPGGALGPGLAGQGQEHQGQQRGSQPVVAVAAAGRRPGGRPPAARCPPERAAPAAARPAGTGHRRRRPARRLRRAAPTGPAPAPRPGAPDRAAPAAARPRPPPRHRADQGRCPGRRPPGPGRPAGPGPARPGR